MRVNLRTATADDAPELVLLRAAVHLDLASKYGKGFWLAGLTEKGVRFAMRTSTVYVARSEGGRLIATLTLSTRKPWAIDKKYFGASPRPVYLTSMAVAPDEQRTGIGRLCVDEARRIVAAWPGDAIRLDAYDAPVGAGDFYRKCASARSAGQSIARPR